MSPMRANYQFAREYAWVHAHFYYNDDRLGHAKQVDGFRTDRVIFPNGKFTRHLTGLTSSTIP
jgi:hypothetical protein